MLANRVAETSTTTGTGTLDLAGAKTGHHAFADKFASGALVRYVIAHQSANEFEYGLGAFTNASPDTLARTTVLGGSNGTSAVNLSAGTKDVFCDALTEDFSFDLMPHQSGQYYAPLFAASSNTSMAKDQLRVMPFWVPRRTTFERHGVNCTGVASSGFRPGVYRDSSGLPGALVSDGGVLATTSTGFVEATISITLDRGWYWVGGAGQTANPTLQAISGNGNIVGRQLPGNGAAPAPSGCYYKTGVTGALPDPYGTPGGVTATGIITWLKAA